MNTFKILSILLIAFPSFGGESGSLIKVNLGGTPEISVRVADAKTLASIKAGLGEVPTFPSLQIADYKGLGAQEQRAQLVADLKDLYEETGLQENEISGRDAVALKKKAELKLEALEKLRESVALNWASDELKTVKISSIKKLQDLVFKKLLITLSLEKLKIIFPAKAETPTAAVKSGS